MRVYLAGPMSGRAFEEVHAWHVLATTKLTEMGWEVLSPMRGKLVLRGTVIQSGGYTDPLFTDAGITARDRWDVSRCDVLLVNLLWEDTISIGTMIELGWADALRKPIVLIASPAGVYANHALVKEIASFTVPDLDGALQVMEDLL